MLFLLQIYDVLANCAIDISLWYDICLFVLTDILTMERKHWELKRLMEAIEKRAERTAAKASALGKLGNYILGKEKPSRATLDRLALFAGFQDWQSFHEALQGEADADANYEIDQKRKADSQTKG